MKIERVSDNQLKLTLTRADLLERDLKLEDLIQPSEKTQKLFRDIMEQALEECDFINENAPLMVEAVPIGIDSIMIIVTKVKDSAKEGTFPNMFNPYTDARKWKKSPPEINETSSGAEDDLLIFSFDSLDDTIGASQRLSGHYHGESSLFKSNKRFFLVLQPDGDLAHEPEGENWELVLDEYGQKHISTPLAKYYLIEHGETILQDDAVDKLAKTFS